jgi:hypothetical protein
VLVDNDLVRALGLTLFKTDREGHIQDVRVISVFVYLKHSDAIVGLAAMLYLHYTYDISFNEHGKSDGLSVLVGHYFTNIKPN